MKGNFLLSLFIMFTSLGALAQVTQINSNSSLQFEHPLTNTKAIYVSDVDQTLWVTDGTLGGTVQLSATITFNHSLGSIGFLDGKFIFSGNTPATGAELYITDGTPSGTQLVSDINPGVPGSAPDIDAAVLNGFLYFTAERPAEGRELWRTNGTPAGTTFVKDIVAGTGGSNYPGGYNLFSSGTYLLLMARTPASGVELWRSDGTDIGTVFLKDINAHNADSSGVQLFYKYNNLVLFHANDYDHGFEPWKTDGTAGGTALVKDINPGMPGSKGLFSFSYFFTFNGRAYFIANEPVNGTEIWGTDGSDINTTLLQNIEPGAASSFDNIFNAVIVGNKFIFPSVNILGTRRQLWESDGTTAGTKLFKDFDGAGIPVIFQAYSYSAQFNQVLFQGTKFFFMAETAAEGSELWVSDGSVANTQIVQNINPGAANGLDATNISYTYTSTAFFFPANNGTNGNELWKTDGTPAGTAMVADIVTLAGSSNPHVDYFIVNNKVLFEANNGDSPTLTDLYAVGGSFTPLPVVLGDFTVIDRAADAVLSWRTLQEQKSKDFTIQRSLDAVAFENIGTVAASGNASSGRAYTYIDKGILSKGIQTVYYRLLMTDVDGKSDLSPVILLKPRNTGNWAVRLLTNPVKENIGIIFSGIATEVRVSVIDLNGKKLYTGLFSNVNGLVSLPTLSLPHGRYVLLAETGKERKTIQFVK
ncbi:MAG: hypothetical protein ABIN01_14195 [Ferruginibacter sp.]